MDSLKFHLGPPCPTLIGPAGWPTRRVGGLRPSSIPLDTPRRTPMVFTHDPPNPGTDFESESDDEGRLQVVEDGDLERELLPAHGRVRQRVRHEEGLESCARMREGAPAA
jgi:hypothetical protein